MDNILFDKTNVRSDMMMTPSIRNIPPDPFARPIRLTVNGWVASNCLGPVLHLRGRACPACCYYALLKHVPDLRHVCLFSYTDIIRPQVNADYRSLERHSYAYLAFLTGRISGPPSDE